MQETPSQDRTILAEPAHKRSVYSMEWAEGWSCDDISLLDSSLEGALSDLAVAPATRPWATSGAFPAGQLCQWNLSYQKYNGNKGDAPRVRQQLVKALSAFVVLNSFQQQLEDVADALDAVICAFAAIAVTTDNLADLPYGTAEPNDEGLIAVCKSLQ